jgi:PAS domain S-box-containing protein
MIPEYQNKRTKRFISILLAASFLIMFLVMFLMQAIKQMILPDMTLWESHWITNIFSALMAVIFALFVIKYLNRYHSRISIEIEQKGILEKELKEAISILDAAIDSTEDGILIVNGEGKVSKSNKKFLELWNMPLSIMESKDDAPLLEYAFDQLKNPEIFLERVQALYKNPLEESFDELYFKDGKIFERYSKPQFVDNNVIGRVWSFRDVTEKKRAEERIKLFEHTIASVNEAVNITDLNDNLIYVNRAFCSTYGYKEEDIIGKHCSIFWSAKTPRDMLQKIRPETLYTGWSGEIDNKRKDGTEFPIHLSTSVIRDHNNKPIALIGVARDISEKKRTENQLMAYTLELQAVNERLSESERNLKELNASKDKFFSIISHDLKSPYQGLLSILDLLIRDYDNLDDEEKKDIFIKIRNSSQRTYNLLDNLLQWSRIQTGKAKYNPEKINLLKVSSDIIDLFCDSSIVKGIAIKNLISEDIFLFADPNMIHLIIRNLLSNAIKFSYPYNEIILSALELDGHVEISVRDFGVGIEAEKAENLFRIDVQNSTMGTARETGTGLGLVLCKDMVTIHKGTIWSKSEKGKGSTFSFTIPME